MLSVSPNPVVVPGQLAIVHLNVGRFLQCVWTGFWVEPRSGPTEDTPRALRRNVQTAHALWARILAPSYDGRARLRQEDLLASIQADHSGEENGCEDLSSVTKY